MTPEIITYSSTKQEVITALENGATHLILSTPKSSVRCFSDIHTPFTQLVKTAQHHTSTIKLSILIDMMVHTSHFEIISDILNEADNLGVHHFVIQDPGLYSFIKETIPQAHIILLSESGNNNLESISYYAKVGLYGQVFSNELCAIHMPIICQKLSDSAFYTQVQGPILIQYSRRRYMRDAADLTDESRYVSQAIDADLPGRKFKFLDSSHGHLMFAHFDRHLLPHINQLSKISLKGWIIDARGESLEYLALTIKLYMLSQKNSFETLSKSSLYTDFKKISTKPQKAGFFLTNKTDTDWRDKKKESSLQLAARLISTAKKEASILECILPLDQNQALVMKTPEGKEIVIRLKQIYTLTDIAIQNSIAGDLVKTPAIKGATQGSCLYIKRCP